MNQSAGGNLREISALKTEVRGQQGCVKCDVGRVGKSSVIVLKDFAQVTGSRVAGSDQASDMLPENIGRRVDLRSIIALKRIGQDSANDLGKDGRFGGRRKFRTLIKIVKLLPQVFLIAILLVSIDIKRPGRVFAKSMVFVFSDGYIGGG